MAIDVEKRGDDSKGRDCERYNRWQLRYDGFPTPLFRRHVLLRRFYRREWVSGYFRVYAVWQPGHWRPCVFLKFISYRDDPVLSSSADVL